MASIVDSSRSFGIRNCLGSKSPTVRLQIFSPAASFARISVAMRRISDPLSDPACGDARKGGPLAPADVATEIVDVVEDIGGQGSGQRISTDKLGPRKRSP